MSRLLIAKGPNTGVSYELGDRTRIGRLGENEIQVPDPNVSRIHAEIIREPQGFVLYDRGSKNGVVVNGDAIAEKQLEPSDQIVIGTATFVFDGQLEILNARYSCNPVFFLPLEDGHTIKTVDCKHEQSSVGSIDAVDISRIFTTAPKKLPGAVLHICSEIQNRYQCHGVALFLRDIPEGPFHPIEVIPRQQPLFTYRQLLDECAVRASSVQLVRKIDPAALSVYLTGPSDPDATPAGPQNLEETPHLESWSELRHVPDQLSYLCTPIMINNAVMGQLLVIRESVEEYSDQDICTLEAMAAFFALTIESLRPALQPCSEQTSALDAEQRSASTRSLRMQEIYNSARRSADGYAPILITGETGTGKETLARFIHENSSRASGPFVAVQCTGCTAEQLEREIFGVEEMDSSGEPVIFPGKLEEALGGTLYLQEVGEIDLSFQPKLLRFLQDRAFNRVGSGCAITADIKLIAASSIDLASAVRSGNFREDLWYRLNVVPFHMPPLRERREDVAPLMDFFIQYYATRLNRRVIGANDSAIALLQKYDWPGNIRELNNAVERAVLLAESKVLSISDFGHIEEARRQLNAKSDLERKRDTRPLAEVERQHIIIALKKHNFNQARAAEALGLHRNTLRNKIMEYGIEIPK